MLKKEKNILKLNIQAFANKNFLEGKFNENYDDKSYWAIIDFLRKESEIRAVWDQDIASYGLIKVLTKLYTKLPIQVSDQEVELVLKSIQKILEENLADHLIVCPLPSAQFKRVIRLREFFIIPQHFTENQKIKEINKAVKKDVIDLKSDIKHTINSRSTDFLKYPLLCINRTEQTSFIHYQAQNLINSFVCALRIYYYGKVFKTKTDNTTIFIPLTTTLLKEASHLAVYSKDTWRSNHNPLQFKPNINFDISWLNRKKYLEEFLEFYDAIYLKANFDKFHLNFLNGMYLFSDLLNQTNSIQTILLMTICESILANSRNEKRLRTSALIPEFTYRNPKNKKEVSFLISELYQMRNNFVHSAEEVTIDYNFELQEPNILEYGKIITSALILNYPKLLNLLNQVDPENNFEGNESRVITWGKYLDEVFKNKVFRE